MHNNSTEESQECQEKCKYCNGELYTKEMLEDGILEVTSTECYHKLHKTCFEIAAFQAKRQKREMKCPICEMHISANEVEQVLNPELMREDDMPEIIPVIKRLTSEEDRTKL